MHPVPPAIPRIQRQPVRRKKHPPLPRIHALAVSLLPMNAVPVFHHGVPPCINDFLLVPLNVQHGACRDIAILPIICNRIKRPSQAVQVRNSRRVKVRTSGRGIVPVKILPLPRRELSLAKSAVREVRSYQP